MKSKSFSRCKRYRCARSLKRDCLYLKQSRSRTDRRKNKEILRHTHDQDKLSDIIRMSGERDII